MDRITTWFRQIMQDLDAWREGYKDHYRKTTGIENVIKPEVLFSMIKRYMNSQGEIVKIYDTDKERTLDKVYNDYFMHNDIWDMEDIITERNVAKEEYGDEFLKRIYEGITYDWVYYHKVDPIYKWF